MGTLAQRLLMKYIIAIGIFQALLAIILLLRSRYRNNADDLLISLVVCIGLHLSIKFYIFNFVKDQQVLTMLNTFIGFSYIPLLYLYTVKTIRPEFVAASRWYLFIPLVIGAIGYFSTICVLAASSTEGHLYLYWYNNISLYTLLSSDIICSFAIIRLALNKLPSFSGERKLIVQLSSIFLTIGILSFILIVFNPFGVSFNYASRSVVYTLLITIVIRIITYKYSLSIETDHSEIKQKVVVSGVSFDLAEAMEPIDLLPESVSFNEKVSSDKIVISEEKPSPILKRKEILRESEMFKVLLKLETAMESEKYFTDSDLTLDKLSKLTSQNKYHVSETLNHFVNKPFYTFVNEYRIRYVKDRLKHLSQKKSSVNMLELAYEAGFNSKSSFNRYFKEITSNTPTEYLNTICRETVN